MFWYNRRWHNYTGTVPEPADSPDWWDFQHPDEVAQVRAGVARALAGQSDWEETQLLRGADGHYRWFLCRGVPIRDAKGGVTRWFGTGTDIHEQREADRRKDEFLATLAHELRNPLAPIRRPARCRGSGRAASSSSISPWRRPNPCQRGHTG